jgi:cyclic pyranopterin phosphate synthase
MTPLRLTDRYGRVATDLRVSLTDRCNLRCAYCMPAEGLAWLPRPELLTDDEVTRLVAIAVQRLGVTEVRFTGGEPLLRPGLLGLVTAAATLSPRPSLSLTTNGIGLDKLARPLAEAGLDRVNVSLDTLSPERFARLTHRDRHADVLSGLAAAVEAGLGPIKINTVLLRGLNDDEAAPLLQFALAHGYELRFIEQMPLDAGHTWSRAEMVTAEEILAALKAEFTLLPDPAERGGAPAQTWIVADSPGHRDSADSPGHPGSADSPGHRDSADSPGHPGSADSPGHPDSADSPGHPDTADSPLGPGRLAPPGQPSRARPAKVGVIASVTRPFCGACDRTRLTADGQVRSCLFSREETDLRGLMRGGAADREIADAWSVAMFGKPAGHGIDDPTFLQPARPMSAIGG